MNPQPDIKKLEEQACNIRISIIEMLSKAGSGHPGGSLSCAEVITVLFFHVLRIKPQDPNWPDRDRFHLSKGHSCPVLYAALAERGYFDKKELSNLRRLGALLQGHPDRRTPGIEVASGSLGQGLSVALGMSLAGRIDKKDYRVYCLMGDGEIQEGNIWEAAMACAHYKCDNLCAVLDYNGFQIDGKISEIMALEPLKDKWQAFGWHAVEINGHNIAEIIKAFEEAKTIKGKPTIIIAKTTKGKGVSCMENVVDFHGRAPNETETKQALEDLKKKKSL
ncbi:MAG: transketolase [Candidatus Omnitrophica bacterium]|nr:transketolase [Candidatus Omnitrophota bacterium]MDD5352877.1 transketolase [Candidatus Omnitrophota bacterium]MDD5550476.1 transketolase [Candidatus Omnitrophota bacterium]